MSFQNNALPNENKPIQTSTTIIKTTNPDKTKVYHSETYKTVGTSNVNDTGYNANLTDRVYSVNERTTDVQNIDQRTTDLQNVNQRTTDLQNVNQRTTYVQNVNPPITDVQNVNQGTTDVENVDENVDNNNKDVNKVKLRKMDSLMNNASEMLLEVFNKNIYPDNRIPINLFQNCKGIMFLRIWKAGIGIGAMAGSGVVLAHFNQTWTQPCAVTLGGIQIGVNVGVERVDDVLLLRDDAALRLFSEKGHFKLGLDASIAVGPYGVDTNTAIAMGGNQTKSIYAYSFAKGVFFGVSLDGGVLTIDNSANEEYYGSKVKVGDIFYGNVIAPQNDYFVKLQQLLNSYCCSNPQQVVNAPVVENVAPVI